MRPVCLILVFLLLGLMPARAAVDQDPRYAQARALYKAGAFDEAAVQAEEIRTSQGQALAARSLLARALQLESKEEMLALYRRAEALAREAIALDGENAEACRLLAISIGYIARGKPPLESWLQGYAGEARALVEKAITLEPDSAWSHAAMGGWHAEIVAAVGDLLADQMAGASLDQAKASFKKAIELDPNNPVLHYEFAAALLRTNDLEVRDLAKNHLALASLIKPKDAFESLVVRRAQQLTTLIKTDGLEGALEKTQIPIDRPGRPETLR